jgi:hypothetical protein
MRRKSRKRSLNSKRDWRPAGVYGIRSYLPLAIVRSGPQRHGVPRYCIEQITDWKQLAAGDGAYRIRRRVSSSGAVARASESEGAGESTAVERLGLSMDAEGRGGQ